MNLLKSWQRRHGFDLDEPFGVREPGHDHRAGCRVGWLEPAPANIHHCRQIVARSEKDGDLAHIGEGAAQWWETMDRRPIVRKMFVLFLLAFIGGTLWFIFRM